MVSAVGRGSAAPKQLNWIAVPVQVLAKTCTGTAIQSQLFAAVLPVPAKKSCDKISLNKIFVILSLYFSLLYGNFHKVENGLKFTNTWELANLRKPTKSLLDQLVDFICCLTF